MLYKGKIDLKKQQQIQIAEIGKENTINSINLSRP
jgi:hypothetical protein